MSMKTRLMIMNEDNWNFKNSVPFECAVLPPIGCYLHFSNETILAITKMIYNSESILDFNECIGLFDDEKFYPKVTNEEVRAMIHHPEAEINEANYHEKSHICIDDYFKVHDYIYNDEDQTFYIRVGSGYDSIEFL